MPYSKTPAISTYDTERQNFVYNPLNRFGSDLNKDARLVNMMVDVVETPDNSNTKTYVKSRPGLSTYTDSPAGVGRGLYYWVYNSVGYVFSVVGNQVYSNGILRQTLATSTGEVGFTEFVTSSGVVSLVMLDGTDGYVFANPTSAPTKIVDAQFPTPHIPMPVFLDATLYVAKAGTEDIYNSDIDLPATWTAGNYISAEMYPDKIIALVKNNNYICAIGSGSVEYLYDAANATGSPLSRHDSAVQQFGTTSPGTVVQTEREVILVGDTNNGGHTVWTIDGFQAKEISNSPIREILRAEGANLATATAHCLRVVGQKLYILNLTDFTLVYSFDTKMWSQWTSGATGSTAFIGSHGADGPDGVPYVLDNANGNVYSLSEAFYDDAGTPFLCSIVTPKYDFDSMNRKFMSRLAIIGDVPTTSGTGNTLQVSWSDDDYQTWSTERTLSFDNDFPVIKQLGNFRRRAFKFNYSQPYRLRLEYFEVDINKGNQ